MSEPNCRTTIAGFLQIEGINGDARDRGYRGWMEVSSIEISPSEVDQSGCRSRRTALLTVARRRSTVSTDIARSRAAATPHNRAECHLMSVINGIEKVAVRVRASFVRIIHHEVAVSNTCSSSTELLRLEVRELDVEVTVYDPMGRPQGTVARGWYITTDPATGI